MADSGKAIGVFLIVLSIGGVVLTLALGGAFGSIGNGEDKQKGTTYCDITGTVSGHVLDYNTPFIDNKNVVDWVLSFNTKANSCKVYQGGFGGFGLSEIPLSPSLLALFGGGDVTVTVKIFNSAQELVGTHSFNVHTDSGQAEKNFSEPVTFKELEKGETYNIKTFISWKGDDSQKEYTITV